VFQALHVTLLRNASSLTSPVAFLTCALSVIPVGLPEMIGGKYRPRNVLGTGATGTVYSVEHSFTGELLALKVMRSHLGGSADAIARFKREARAVSKVRSQHVVRIFDADVAPELGGLPYLVMDLLEGIDLEQLSGDKAVAPESVVEWLRQVALALDKAHRIGVIHRDLKPENLFLTRQEDGSPLIKILDFGIAKIVAESPGTTQWGQLFGTPLYMAPEQARGDPTQVGPQSDLFAVGLIAYKLLTGTAYRTGTSLTGILNEILHEPLQAPSERGHAIGPDFDQWFLRACHADLAKRFGSADEQVEALASALGLPAGAEAKAKSASSQSMHETHDARTSQPDSSGNALISLRAAAAEKNAAGAGIGAGMLPSSLSEKSDSGVERNRWRFAFFAVSALVALPLLVIVLSRGRSQPRDAVAAKSSACPIDSVAAPPTSTAPSTPPGSPVAVPAALALEQPGKATAAPVVPAAPAEREPIVRMQQPPRAYPARTVVPRNRGPVDDDPLSDQQ
jgi:eukaryotic-like serine/threonine-protein kinase